MILVLLWAIAILCGFTVITLGVMHQQAERLAKALEMQMIGLGHTHLQGLEIVTGSLERLEARVKAIEEEVS